MSTIANEFTQWVTSESGTTGNGDTENVGSKIEPGFVSAAQLLEANPKLQPPIIHGLLRAGETLNLISAPKIGKSWLTLDLMLSIATGREWLGFPVERGNVLLFDNELHPATLADRLRRVMDARGIKDKEIRDVLYIKSLRGCLKDLHALKSYFCEIGPGRFSLIGLDAFYRFLPERSDENSNSDVKDLYNKVDQYAAMTGAAFILVHHSSKGNQGTKVQTDVGSGAGAQSRAADCHLTLRPHEEPGAYVLEAASRSWPPIAPTCLRWKFPIWNPDKDLDPTKLAGTKPKKTTTTPEAGKPKLDPAGFVAKYLSTEPKAKNQVMAHARQDGMGAREADDLLALALEGRQAFKWRFAKDLKVYLATIEQPVTRTQEPGA